MTNDLNFGRNSTLFAMSDGCCERLGRSVACVGIGVLLFVTSLAGTAFNEYRSVIRANQPTHFCRNARAERSHCGRQKSIVYIYANNKYTIHAMALTRVT